MQATKPRFVFLWLLMLAGALHTRATAQESLGDPVLNETFGKGTNFTPIGQPLPEAVTTLHFVADKCPINGNYTIASACWGDTWHSVYQDHTRSDPNGYMMIINASETPSVFYVQRVNGATLCPGAKYQLSVWILNVLVTLPITQGYIEPDITYTIETTSGQVLETYNTGPIAATSTLNWKQYTQTFNAPADGSDVIVRLRNNSSGGTGNDLILDDITVKPIGPVIDLVNASHKPAQ
jgi:hypothetical protein